MKAQQILAGVAVTLAGTMGVMVATPAIAAPSQQTIVEVLTGLQGVQANLNLVKGVEIQKNALTQTLISILGSITHDLQATSALPEGSMKDMQLDALKTKVNIVAAAVNVLIQIDTKERAVLVSIAQDVAALSNKLQQ